MIKKVMKKAMELINIVQEFFTYPDNSEVIWELKRENRELAKKSSIKMYRIVKFGHNEIGLVKL
jgi:protoheme ferro-lyase